eukprot:m.247162 g.247162  ORF g.247162 m.247162 type:complete len:86 (+) comp15390_c0_seq2:4205-4462(+)
MRLTLLCTLWAYDCSRQHQRERRKKRKKKKRKKKVVVEEGSSGVYINNARAKPTTEGNCEDARVSLTVSSCQEMIRQRVAFCHNR